MNDPMDLGFYINPERAAVDDRVLIFQKSICENCTEPLLWLRSGR